MAKLNDVLTTLRLLRSVPSRTMLGSFQRRKYNAYRILISTILSARARDEVTEVIAEKLFRRYPDSHSLAHANPEDVQKIIKPIGFYRQKTKSIISTARDVCYKYRDRVPGTLEGLMTLRGVGRKVANCVLVYSFGKDAIPVDTHVHKLSNHFGWVKTRTPEQTEFALMRMIPRKYWQTVNDTLVSHGKSINYRKFPHRGTRLEKYCRTCRGKK